MALRIVFLIHIEYFPPPSMAASNQAKNSIVVISPQYCTPYQVDLYIAKRVKKITEGRHLGVFDINGNNIFKVITSGHFSSRLILVDAAGVPVVSLKPMKWSPHQRWKVYNGDSSDSKDLLFTVKKSHYLQFKIELDVFLSSNKDEDVCDFRVKQNLSEKSCIIYQGNSDNIIAEMHKNKDVRDKVHGKDTFLVTVNQNVDRAFVVAIGAVLNEVNTPSSMSGGAAENNSIVVISPQYCAAYQVDLYTAKRVKKVTESRHLGVFDINGNNIFKVKTNGHFSSRLILVDAAGVPVISLKPVKYSFHQRWKVYRGDSSEPGDLLFTVKKSQYLQFKIQLDVFLASNTAEDVCDFKMKQPYNEKSCVIYRGNSENIIAEMQKNKAVRDKVRGKDTFSVTVSPNVDYAFVIAMVAVLNEVNTPSSSSTGGAGGGGGGGGGGGACGGG
ncbi:hypothetical protein MKW92_024032 [Papaver armeniacum]|nr:hypothetical protein MKW92_024032 [Papaver armeniacum]